MPPDHSLDEARWQAVLLSAQDAIICIDRDGRVSLFNPAAERIFGYDSAEIVGEMVDRLMPSPYAEEHDGYIRQYETTGMARAIGRVRDVMAKRRDGSVFPIELSVAHVESGTETTYTAIIRDVTDRRSMEEQIRAERDFADSLIDTAQVVVLVLDTEGRILRFNRHLEEISGWTLAETHMEDWFTRFLPDRDRSRIEKAFAAALEGGDVHGVVNSIVTKSGDERNIQWHAKHLVDRDQKVIGVVAVGQDLTERLAAEERLSELEHSARQRDRLADIGAITAKVVHDLGNPLAALSMQAQLILRRAKRRDFEPPEVVEGPVQQMLETVNRLEVLVREFTDFAREQRLRLTKTPLLSYISNVTQVWEAYASSRGVALEIEAEPNLPEIHADPDMFRRVLDNVLKNAIDAIDGDGGKVVVTAALCKQNRVCICIDDDGCGIPDGIDVFRLFETTKEQGTGIGLAIAKQIVSAHNGDIGYESRTPRGTRFHIELPINGPQAA